VQGIHATYMHEYVLKFLHCSVVMLLIINN